jgi:hypothetical protein
MRILRTAPKLLTALLLLSGGAALAQVSPAAKPAAAAESDVQPTVAQLKLSRPTHILFVGNSYFYYNDSLHNHVQRMAVAAGVLKEADVTYKSATIGGAALSDHNIDHLLDPKNLRVDRPFEVVIMQDASAAPLSQRGRQKFEETATLYAQKVRAAGGEPVLYMTHAYVPPHRQHRPGMIRDIASMYVGTGNRIGALVIPVGLAFEEAYRRKPGIRLHTSFDGSHPSMLGTYLAACTVLASLYGVSPVGNSYTYFGEVSAEDAQFLQGVAQDIVADFHRRARQQ